MLLKKKWSSVKRNPERAMKQVPLGNQYWHLMNDLPKNKVNHLVTPYILKLDKRSCNEILKSFLREKQTEDIKKQIMSKDKLINRNKMVARHNRTLSMQTKLGIKIGTNVKGRRSAMDDIVNDDMVSMTTTFGNFRNTKTKSLHNHESQDDYRSTDEFHQSLDTYNVEHMPEFTQSKIGLRTIFNPVNTYSTSERLNILSMPKTTYNGKDFFQKKEFRGLLLADHQEALGKKAFECIDELNVSTGKSFNSLSTFREETLARSTQQSFYKENTRVNSKLKESYLSNDLNMTSSALILVP